MISVVNDEEVDSPEKLEVLRKIMVRRINIGSEYMGRKSEKMALELYKLEYEHSFFRTRIRWDARLGRMEITEVEFDLHAHGKIENLKISAY